MGYTGCYMKDLTIHEFSKLTRRRGSQVPWMRVSFLDLTNAKRSKQSYFVPI